MIQQGESLEALQEALGYRFTDPALLEAALVHESFANEREEDVQSYERLEFLGDSVLGLVVAGYLYERFPDLPEGRLAQIKATLVSTHHLAQRAREIGLGAHVRLGRGEQMSAGRKRVSLLADALEAVVGAVYLDGGFDASHGVVLKLLQDDMDLGEGLRRDFKSLLQEITQKHFKTLPEYHVMREEGPPHDRIFQVQVVFGGEALGEGTGPSKREASQEAAREALDKVRRGAPEWIRLMDQVPPNIDIGG